MSIPKYILYGPELQLLMSFSVDFHLELIPKSGTTNQVKGGGRIAVDDKEKKVLLYWESTDFGPVKKEELLEAVKTAWFSLRWDGYKVFYAPPEAGILPLEVWPKAEEIFTIQH